MSCSSTLTIMLNKLRTWVSENRTRLIDETSSTNLDLSYITPRIIAMGFPSEGFESLFRNSLGDVKRFLDSRHLGHYKVFNLRSEKLYNGTKFDAPVANFPFDDHQSPPFDMLLEFCTEASAWLEKDPENVVVVHCKAGKGRTGTMISALLLYLGEAKNAAQAIKHYGTKRTLNGKGVTMPSQLRYVRYFDQMLKTPIITKRPLKIVSIIMNTIPSHYRNNDYVVFSIFHNGQEIYDQDNRECIMIRYPDYFLIKPRGIPTFSGDFKVVFYRSSLLGFKETPICHFWLHTAFIPTINTVPGIHLDKASIDKASKDTMCREFNPDFSIDIKFE
ncbi:protein-tyrosine phosphatase-like protein [Phycomyces nitens]|nr:protein-tyrosine phosphatase-like protein [Phycomyces nitens]